MDRPVGVCLDLGLFDVQRLAENVEDVALDAVADGHGDGRTGVPHSGAADEAVGCLQGDGANEVVTQVLGSLERNGFRLAVESDLSGQSVVNRGDCVSREFDVDNRTNNTGNAAGSTGRSYVFGSSGSHLSHFTQ